MSFEAWILLTVFLPATPITFLYLHTFSSELKIFKDIVDALGITEGKGFFFTFLFFFFTLIVGFFVDGFRHILGWLSQKIALADGGGPFDRVWVSLPLQDEVFGKELAKLTSAEATVASSFAETYLLRSFHAFILFEFFSSFSFTSVFGLAFSNYFGQPVETPVFYLLAILSGASFFLAMYWVRYQHRVNAELLVGVHKTNVPSRKEAFLSGIYSSITSFFRLNRAQMWYFGILLFILVFLFCIARYNFSPAYHN